MRSRATRSTSISSLAARPTSTLGNGQQLKMTQETRYPWAGAVKHRRRPRARRHVHRQRAHSRLGAQRAGAGRLYRFRRHHRAPVRSALNGKARAGAIADNGYARSPHVEGGRRRSSSTCRCRSGGSRANDEWPPIAIAWRCSAVRSSTPPSGPTIPNGKVRNIVLPRRPAADGGVPAESAERRRGDQGQGHGVPL